jgi:hypothetical protein
MVLGLPDAPSTVLQDEDEAAGDKDLALNYSFPLAGGHPAHLRCLLMNAADFLIATSDSGTCGITGRIHSTGPSIAMVLFHNRRVMGQWATLSAVTGRD